MLIQDLTLLDFLELLSERITSSVLSLAFSRRQAPYKAFEWTRIRGDSKDSY